jgi:hypothetical protein
MEDVPRQGDVQFFGMLIINEVLDLGVHIELFWADLEDQ